MRSFSPTMIFPMLLALSLIQGFQREPIIFTTRRPTMCRQMSTRQNMISMNDIHKDPDALFEMVEELAATDEFMPEAMEELQLALATFVDEASTQLLEQESRLGTGPKPPSIPPPGALLGMENDIPWQPRDLASDLRKAGAALELLQERLAMEEEALTNGMFPTNYMENNGFVEEQADDDDFDDFSDEEDILFQAEEALRKSREAAEKRRMEAEARTMSAARLSAEYRQQEAFEDEQQEEDEDFDDFYHQETEGLNVPKKRPTMQLNDLFGATTAMPLRRNNNNNNVVPEGVPTLYNWIQNEDGTISGNIAGSPNFKDGARISTSFVPQQARGGMTIATQSGSRYFLEDFYDEENSSPQAPDGVPTVKSWEVRSGGGIIGLIYDSPYADDGDYIETSPIVEGEIDNYSLVSTESGSQYFLSGDPPEDAADKLANFEQQNSRTFGTITLPKGIPRNVRSTFSLMDLFEDDTPQEAMYLRDGPPRPLPPPFGKIPPEGTPALTGCVFNDNGTITGYVFGSPTMRDGTMITTSPIVDGIKEQFETVRTASGSLYYLG